jgi:hypothetical protein
MVWSIADSNGLGQLCVGSFGLGLFDLHFGPQYVRRVTMTILQCIQTIK